MKNIDSSEKKSTSNKNSSLLASGLALSFFTLCSRILGLVREMTKASFLGTTKFADAFGIAFMIPNLLRRLFAENSISVAFIPTFKHYLEDSSSREGYQSTKDFLNATLTLISFCTTIVVIIGIIVAPFLVPIFLDSKDSELLRETAFLTRIMFPYLFVISVAAFFQGILNGVKIFSPSGFTPVLFNTIVISVTYILTPILTKSITDAELRACFAARAMAVGVILGGCVQAVFQLPFVIKTGWKCHFTSLKKAFSNPGTKKVISLIVPTILGMAAYQLNDVVSTALAGKAGTGIVSSLQYSLRLQELILGIFAVSIGTVILPDLSGLAKSEQWKEFNNLLTQAIKIIALISIPVTFYSLLNGKEIISLVYKSKSFDDKSVSLTLNAFTWHIVGLFFIAMNRVVSPAFYAQGNTKSPALAGILGFVFNILFAILFVSPLKGGGIALALSLASFANSVFLFAFLRKNKSININSVIKGSILYASKIIVFSAIALIPTFFVKNLCISIFSNYNRIICYGMPLLLTFFTFASIGILLLLITKDSIVKSIVLTVKRRLSK